MAARQLAFALVRESPQQEVRHGERQNAVAQEFQTFVAVREGRLELGPAVERAAMGQRFGSIFGMREDMTNTLRQRREINVRRNQWIAMKKRFQRIASGHFHGSNHPATDGSCEKKMNSARPTRFSEGTYQPSWFPVARRAGEIAQHQPRSAVERIVSIVAHHEIAAGRHEEFRRVVGHAVVRDYSRTV